MTNRPDNQDHKLTIESDPIHRILAAEEPILPLSGFLASVMERVEEESRAPARIPFPWKRAVPGFVLASGMFGWGAYEFIRYGVPSLRDLALAQSPLPPSATHPLEQAAWVALALAVSLVSWKLSRRLSGQT
jgi:hypothetical protein